MRSVLPVLAAAALAGCASSAAERTANQQEDQQRLATELAGLTPDKPTACMNEIRAQSQLKAVGSTLLYKVGRGLVYRNDTTGGCERVGQDILVTKSPSGRLCRGDIATTVDRLSGVQTGSCALGDFVAYRRR